jgi:hypothetical protein
MAVSEDDEEVEAEVEVEVAESEIVFSLDVPQDTSNSIHNKKVKK